MSKTTNCLNCGAPFDTDKEKCPYCGTSYYDMSAIDINNDKPFMLKIKMGSMYVTQLVRVSPDISFDITSDTVDCINDLGVPLQRFCTNQSLNINMMFEAVPRKDNTLFTVRTNI